MGLDEDLDAAARAWGNISVEELKDMKLSDLKRYTKEKLGYELRVKFKGYKADLHPREVGIIVSKEEVESAYYENLFGRPTISEKISAYFDNNYPKTSLFFERLSLYFWE